MSSGYKLAVELLFKVKFNLVFNLLEVYFSAQFNVQ